jgi:hypothetical protein
MMLAQAQPGEDNFTFKYDIQAVEFFPASAVNWYQEAQEILSIPKPRVNAARTTQHSEMRWGRHHRVRTQVCGGCGHQAVTTRQD